MKWIIKRFDELENSELYAILQLRCDVFIVEQACAYADCDGKDNNAIHFYLKEDNQIIAYLRILNKGVSYDEISIGRVVVKKEFRGCNIARRMLSDAIVYIESELKEYRIKIQAQSYLLPFYKSLGFKEVSNEYLEDNIPHIDMLYDSQVSQ